MEGFLNSTAYWIVMVAVVMWMKKSWDDLGTKENEEKKLKAEEKEKEKEEGVVPDGATPISNTSESPAASGFNNALYGVGAIAVTAAVTGAIMRYNGKGGDAEK